MDAKRMKRRAYDLERRYGLSLEEYEEMLDSQKSRCIICGEAHRNDDRLHVDHRHSDNSVRGLLCRRCNIMIGQARESVDILKNAVVYLNRFNNT